MFPSPALPWFELARFRRSRLTRAAVLAVAVVPLFYGALYIWANLDPTGRLDHVKAAVVNEDQMIEVKNADGGKDPVAVGRLLAGNLIGDDAKNNYDWVLTDPRDAAQGLADGSYKAVLTIPKDLSKAAVSPGGDDPAKAVQGKLDLQTNDAVNFVNGQIADRVLDAARDALNAQVTGTYLDNLYLSLGTIRSSLGDAADGAGRLVDGSGKLVTGADQATDGAHQLGDGTQRLDDGVSRLADGADQLAGGAERLSSGTSDLASALATLQQRTQSLPAGTEKLAVGSQRVADGIKQYNAAILPFASGVADTTAAVAGGLNPVVANLRALQTQCERSLLQLISCSTLEQTVTQVTTLQNQLRDVTGAGAFRTQAQQLEAGAQQVADGNRDLARSTPALVDAIRRTSVGAGQVDAGSSELSTKVGEAASGANQLAAGTGELTSGADRLADGTTQLSDGARQLQQGAIKLRSGLTDGKEQVPSYSKADRDRLSKVAATPVTTDDSRLHGVASYGQGLAPYFMALALWVGAMAIFLLLRPISARAIASTTGSVRTALAGFVPGAVLSLVQVVLLVAVLLGVVGLDAAQPWLLVGIAVLTGLVFTAINQAFIAWFGGAGRFLAIVFVCLQLTAAGGTYPIETSPGFFGTLHGLLPMTYAVHGLRAATAGGTEGVAQDVTALLLFGVIGLLATTVAAQRRQRLTMTRLHPTLRV